MIYMISSIPYVYEIYDVDIQWNEKIKQHRENDNTCIIHTDSQFSNHWDMTVLMTPIYFVSSKRLQVKVQSP